MAPSRAGQSPLNCRAISRPAPYLTLRLAGGFHPRFERSKLPVPEPFVICLRRIASFARAHTLSEEPPLHRVARESERFLEVLAGGLVPPAAKLKLTERGGIERIYS